MHKVAIIGSSVLGNGSRVKGAMGFFRVQGDGSLSLVAHTIVVSWQGERRRGGKNTSVVMLAAVSLAST